MLTLVEAQNRILAGIQPLGVEPALLPAAAGRILRAGIRAPMDLPPFDNSAMDGYAVRSADLATASPARPVGLRCQGRMAAGDVLTGELAAHACVRVFTGSLLPPGADAVVMQEDIRLDHERRDLVWFAEPTPAGENIRPRGEDVRQGEVLVEAGTRLTAGHLALLGAVGCQQVTVGRQPQVALLATGSELREPGEPLAPGQIYESNRAALASLAAQAGARPCRLPLVADAPELTRQALAAAFTHADVVVTSGGVSVGELDFVKGAFEGLGGEVAFWKVAIKPGKPFVFGRWRQKLWFGLPGNPVSAFVTFWLLVRPALVRLQGAAHSSLPVQTGVLAEGMDNMGDRPHYVRVQVHAGQVRLAGRQASHVLKSLAAANGLVEIPARTSLAAGTSVAVLVWD